MAVTKFSRSLNRMQVDFTQAVNYLALARFLRGQIVTHFSLTRVDPLTRLVPYGQRVISFPYVIH
jgi:hypothetical protein